MGTARPLARLERNERIEEETARIVELYRELDDVDAVAAALIIKPSRVRRRMRDAGVSIAVLRVEHAVNVFRETHDVAETAQRIGVSIATTRKRLYSGVVIGLLDEMPETDIARIGTPRPGGAGGGRRRLDPALEAETIDLYRELKSLRKVGFKLGITQEVVRLRLRNAGFVLERHPTLTPEEEEQAVAFYEETRNVQEVAARLGRSPLPIRKALDRAGVDVCRGARHVVQAAPRLQRKIGEARMIKRLYDNVGSEVAVAALLGCSQTHVSNRLKLIGSAPGRGRRTPLGPRQPEIARQVIAAYESGASGRAAARTAGVQPQTAYRWLRTAGYDTSKAAAAARRKAA